MGEARQIHAPLIANHATYVLEFKVIIWGLSTMLWCEKNISEYNGFARIMKLLPRTLLAVTAVVLSGLAHSSNLTGFIYTDTIDPSIRPFEIDNAFFNGGNLDGNIAVCTQGIDDSSIQHINVYTGTLRGQFFKTPIASGGQYFSVDCYTFNDTVFGTFINSSWNGSLVAFELLQNGNVVTTTIGGQSGGVFTVPVASGAITVTVENGFNAAGSAPIQIDGMDYMGVVGVLRDTLESVVFTTTHNLTSFNLVGLDSASLKDPFSGGVVPKVVPGGAGEIVWIGQEPDNDLVLKTWHYNDPVITGTTAIKTSLINDNVDSLGDPPESGLVNVPGGWVACYFDGQNPTLSMIDAVGTVSDTVLPANENYSNDIDCRALDDGTFDLGTAKKYYNIDRGGTVKAIHNINAIPSDGYFAPLAVIGDRGDGLFSAGSLGYGLDFDQIIPPSVAVPTLQDWALIILALILLGIAGWATRRQIG